MMKRNVLLLFLLPSLLFAAGNRDDTVAAREKGPMIFASNYPLYFAAERIIGGQEAQAEILWLFPKDEDPAFWEPERADLTVVQDADLLLFNGADYEKWRNYAFLEDSRITDSSESFRDLYIDSGEGLSHSHGGGEEHSHGGTAFTLWLDLKLYERQLMAVKQALIDLVPEKKDQFQDNHRAFQSELLSLNKAFIEAGRPFKDEILLASHPVYQYFSRAYLGDIQAVFWEPGLYPSEEDWAVLEALKEESGARFMLWEDEPLSETRSRLEKMGLEIIIIKPGFDKPRSGTFTDVIRSNLKELQRAGGLV